MKFKKINNLLAIVVFVNSLITYWLTIERQFSFWDVAEYIVSSAKLGVTHAPGAATFQIIGATLSSLAFGEGKYYSLVINGMSGLFSALTILLLFYTISHLVRRVILGQSFDNSKLSQAEKIITLGSALVGSLVFTYSDTFWFSASEGEVYSMASLFIAIILWLICRWETEANEGRSNRWLILISLVIGLSVGVHLMAILAVPVVVLIYFIRKFPLTWKNFILSNVLSLVVLGVVFKLIFPLTMTYFGAAERVFVNDFRLPFNSGTVFALVTLLGGLSLLIFFFQKYRLPELHTITLSVSFMIIGLLTWLVIPIRANANPPVNLNNPDTAIGLLDYYNREQYGEWPVLYGNMYTAFLEEDALDVIEKGPIYERNNRLGIYEQVGKRTAYEFKPSHTGLFPKLYNPDPKVMENYAKMVGYPDFTLNTEYGRDQEEQQLAERVYKEMRKKYESGEITIEDYTRVYKISRSGSPILFLERPSLAQNLNYFLNFQIGYMYMRYLMWNFAGRQNDWEGSMETHRGNWISGIPFLDNYRLGDQNLLSGEFKENKARNTYFLLPFLLGFLGLVFQAKRDPGRAYALFILFMLTSFGIIMYTSVKPFEPRERDYAVVGSFYVFSIWVGFGVLALFDLIKQRKNKNLALVLSVLSLGIPLLMAFQNWDDHDRSRRKTAYDLAKNYLRDLDENSIIFVYGDNDTYPLWGLQETEEFRDDVKVVNFTLLSSPWNINQVKRQTYSAAPLPGKLTYDNYKLGVNDRIYTFDKEQLIDNINQAAYIVENGLEIQTQFTQTDFQNILKLQNYFERDSMSVTEAMEYLEKDLPEKRALLKILNPRGGRELNFIPVKKLYIPVDKEQVKKHKIVAPEDEDKVLDQISFRIRSGAIYKAELAILDMLRNYDWSRPIYFSAGGLYGGNQLYMNDYLQYEGFVSKLVPIKTSDQESGYGHINIDVLKRNIENYNWGNLNHPKAYFDETSKRNFLGFATQAVAIAASELNDKGRKEEAAELLDLLKEKIPPSKYIYNSIWGAIAGQYLKNGKIDEAEDLIKKKIKNLEDKYAYFESLPERKLSRSLGDFFKIRTSYINLAQNITIPFIKEEVVDKESAKRAFLKVYNPVTASSADYLERLDKSPANEVVEQKFLIGERFGILRGLEGFASEAIDSSFAADLDKGNLKRRLNEKYQSIYGFIGSD